MENDFKDLKDVMRKMALAAYMSKQAIDDFVRSVSEILGNKPQEKTCRESVELVIKKIQEVDKKELGLKNGKNIFEVRRSFNSIKTVKNKPLKRSIKKHIIRN